MSIYHRKSTANIKYFFIIVFYIFCSKAAFTDQKEYGPRFEIGIGGSGFRLQSRPDWSSKYYGSGIFTSSFRIFRGLSILGGKDMAFGRSPRSDWFNYGNHYQIDSGKGTYMEGSLLGLRYDIPLRKFNIDIEGIHTVYCGGGLLWDEYGIRSKNQKFYYEEKAWEYDKAPDEVRDSLRHFKTADLKGYYFTLAARWRIDTESIEEKDSWIGAYGLDIGLKYARYSKCTPEYENITEAKSNFNYYQIFIVGFVKIRFFY